jgi:hypothetical protein
MRLACWRWQASEGECDEMQLIKSSRIRGNGDGVAARRTR